MSPHNNRISEEGENMKIINNPFDTVIRAVQELYPGTQALIQFNPDLRGEKHGECGCTSFPDDEGQEILVDISTNIPFLAMIEILAHELAHVVTGPNLDDDHGPEWQSVFNAIQVKYEELIDLEEQEYGSMCNQV
jgi:hypothetical protein